MYNGTTFGRMGELGYCGSKTVGYGNTNYPIAAKALVVSGGVGPSGNSYYFNTSGNLEDTITTSLRCLHQP